MAITPSWAESNGPAIALPRGDDGRDGDAARSVPAARPSTARRQHPQLDRGRLRSSDVIALRRRPHGGPSDRPSPLRLVETEGSRERPPHLLQGSRVAALV